MVPLYGDRHVVVQTGQTKHFLRFSYAGCLHRTLRRTGTDFQFDSGLPPPWQNAVHNQKKGSGVVVRHRLLPPWVRVDHFDVTCVCGLFFFYCPQLLFFLLWLCLPLALSLALRIDLWVLTGCWLVSSSDAALYWLVDVRCHLPPDVPQGSGGLCALWHRRH